MPWLLLMLACTGGDPPDAPRNDRASGTDGASRAGPDGRAEADGEGGRAEGKREARRAVYGLRGVDWACAPCGDLSSLGGGRVKVSSTLSPESQYGAQHLTDGDLDTAWCEGARGDGSGSTLTLELDRPVVLEAIGVWGAYLKSDKTLRDNHRVRSVVARAGRARTSWTLADPAVPVARDPSTGADVPAAGWLVHVKQSEPPWTGVRPLSSQPVRRVTLMIESVYPGSAADDLCISEIDLLGIDPAEL
jgi:hypothetical protein